MISLIVARRLGAEYLRSGSGTTLRHSLAYDCALFTAVVDPDSNNICVD